MRARTLLAWPLDGKVSGTIISWPTARAKHGFQTKPLRHAFHPLGAAKGLSPVRTSLQRRQFLFALGTVDARRPVLGAHSATRRAMLAPPRRHRRIARDCTIATVRPGRTTRRARHSARRNDTRSTDVRRLDQERLEPPLVHMPASDRAVVGVPTLGVRQTQPADEARKIAVFARPHHQMPMIRHHTIRQKPHLHRSTACSRIRSNAGSRPACRNPICAFRPVEHVVNKPPVVTRSGRPMRQLSKTSLTVNIGS